jgi:hypothetical protein
MMMLLLKIKVENDLMNVREPILHPVDIAKLRPTQITVGMREVQEKRKRWREKAETKKSELLGKHMIPVIVGPNDLYCIIDHHHLARALQDEGEKVVLVSVVRDLRNLNKEMFWTVLDHHGWVHPYDEEGVRRGYKAIPKLVADLIDDPFRSLAGELRRAGGFAKDTTPFSEFLWADFLRHGIKRSLAEGNPETALEKAMVLAKSLDANYLPGWCGPVTETQ